MDENMIKFRVSVTMNRRWAPHFVSMLRMMESFGRRGHSGYIGIYSDGDGDFRPEFKVSPILLNESNDVLINKKYCNDCHVVKNDSMGKITIFDAG